MSDEKMFVVEKRINGVLVATSDPYDKETIQAEGVVKLFRQLDERSNLSFGVKDLNDPFEQHKENWIQKVARKVFRIPREDRTVVPVHENRIAEFKQVYVKPTNRFYFAIGMRGEEGQLRQQLIQVNIDVTVRPEDLSNQETKGF